MRKELTAISAVSMAISFMAAIVLCVQLAQNKLITGWQPDGPALWALEIAVFGVATYLWRRDVSLGGWSLGIVALVFFRLAITMASAVAFTFVKTSFLFDRALVPLSAFLPRTCAVFFALMICYPLRVFLPARISRQRREAARRRAQEAGAEDPTSWYAGQGERPAVSFSPTRPEWQSFAPAVSEQRFTGSIDVPLRAVLANVPENRLSPDAKQYDATFPVSIPLSLIGPQLNEARLVLRLDDLGDLLPPRVLVGSAVAPGLEGEPVLVSLALEEVVPLLPPEVLELPAPSPPAWASLPDPENVVFAVV